MRVGLALVLLLKVVSAAVIEDYENNESVQLLRQYIRINTTTHNDLTPAVEFWRERAESVNLTIDVHEFTTGYPVVVMKWPGQNDSLPSIMLNSHMDVVPVDEAQWTYPPFDANMTDEGEIYGRGVQDCKSVGLMHFEAMRRIKENNITLLRDVYITLMPDEEVGGEDGMVPFSESEEFAAMNVGCELDEGGAATYPQSPIFIQDKAVWQIEVTCEGESSHSSTAVETNATAVGKCRNVINRFLEFREEQDIITAEATVLNAGVYTTVNLNIMDAGTANNVVPDTVRLVFDIRLATSLNSTEFEATLNEWLTDAGDNITMSFEQKDAQSAKVLVANNPYYTAISTGAAAVNLTIVPIVSPGATDARYLRLKNYVAFGFAPMPNTTTLLHADNERLNASIFLNGIDVIESVLLNLGNLSYEDTANTTGLVVQSEE